jgi:glutaminyl-peptide cyclotransferase
MGLFKISFTTALAFLLAGCQRSGTGAPPPPPTTAAATPVYSYHVTQVYPHDTRAFTEGLVFVDGSLYESVGMNGESGLRKVNLVTGQIEQRLDLAPEYFGEGLAALNGKLYQLTWKNQKGFVYDLKTFKLEREFQYTGEGWGLATDGKLLIMSDGTDQIRFLDPETFTVRKTIHVTDQGAPVADLNELEWVKGEIFANVWKKNVVARVDPVTGAVRSWVNFAHILPASDANLRIDVFNGIAYDAQGDRLFVTGKYYPKLFEVKIRE